MHFSSKYVTFGITEITQCIETQVEKFIILLGKYFLFKIKCQKTQPTLAQFKLYLGQRNNVEKQIYFTNLTENGENLKSLIDNNT